MAIESPLPLESELFLAFLEKFSLDRENSLLTERGPLSEEETLGPKSLRAFLAEDESLEDLLGTLD